MAYKHIKLIILVFLLLLIPFGLTGCPGKEEEKVETKEKVKIGVSLVSMEFDGNQAIKKIMDERKKKDKADITWMDAKMDPAKQEKDIDQLIKQKVKAIILQTVDPKEGAKLVDKILQAKIKVVALETLPLNAPLDGYVAADHVRAGELQGKFILDQIKAQSQQGSQGQGGSQQQGGQDQGGSQQQGGEQGGQGSQGNQGSQGGQSDQGGGQQGTKKKLKVLILKGDPSDPVSQQIATAARTVLEQSKDIESIKIAEHPEGDPQLAQMTVHNTLKEEKIDAILATDDRMAEAAVKVLKAQAMDGMVVTLGVGGDKKITEALSAGEHDAEIDIMPEQLANFAFDAVLDLIEKGNWNSDTRVQNGNFDIPAKIIPVRLIEKDQVHLLEARHGKQKKEEEKQQESGKQEESSEGSFSEGESKDKPEQEGQSKGDKEQKTKLKITTQEGKVMEVEVKGEIKKIEQSDGEKGKEGGGKGEQGEEGGGSQGEQGSQ